VTGAHSQTFKAARVTVAPDRSRQVVSERNTFPQMTSLCGRARHRLSQEWLRHKGSILNQNLRSRPDLFLPTSFTAWCYLWEHSVFSQKVWLQLWLIRTLITLLCVREEENFNLGVISIREAWQHDLNSPGRQCSQGTVLHLICAHIHTGGVF